MTRSETPMTKTRWKITLTLLLLAAGVRLFGQDYRTFRDEFTDVRERQLLRLGPLRILPVFRLSNLGYDSNVYYRDRQDEILSDYTATVSPEVTAYWLLGNSLMLSTKENPEYVFYLERKDLRTLTNSISPAFRLLLLQRIALSGEYHHERHIRRAYSEFELPLRNTRKGYAASAFLETPRETAIGFSGALDDYRYDNPATGDPLTYYSLTLDRRERSASFEFYYRVFSQSFFFTKAGYSDYTFAHPESAWRNAYSYKTTVGIRFPLLGRARGTVSLGYKKFVPRSVGRQAFSGLVADTDVSFRVWRLGLAAGYVRDNYFSYLETAYYYVEDRFHGGLSFYIFPFLRLDGNIQVGDWRYPEPLEVWYRGIPIIVENRKDTNRTFSVGLTVRIVGNAGLGVSYNFYRRTSNAPGYDIGRNFFGANLTYDF